MTALPLVITDGGRLAIINAAAAGTDAVRVVSVGVTAASFVATHETGELPGEIKRLTALGGGITAQDTIHVTARDDGGDDYTVRAFGLFLADGTLLAAYSQAAAIFEKTALSSLVLDLNIKLSDAVAGTISFGDVAFTDPLATASVAGIVRFSSNAEAIAGTVTNRAITPANLTAVIADRRGAANGLASLDSSGKIPSGQLPALAITDTFPVSSQSQMLALDAQVGDIAIRSDVSRSYILRTAGAGTLANWSELKTPTDTVLSVNGRTGAVNLVPVDIGGSATAAQMIAATTNGVVVTPASFGALDHSHGQTGYQVMPGGLILQWGRFTASANGSTNVTFPLEFPNACYAVTVSGAYAGGVDSKDNPPGVVASSISGASFSVYSADDDIVVCCFQAIGK